MDFKDGGNTTTTLSLSFSLLLPISIYLTVSLALSIYVFTVFGVVYTPPFSEGSAVQPLEVSGVITCQQQQQH